MRIALRMIVMTKLMMINIVFFITFISGVFSILSASHSFIAMTVCLLGAVLGFFFVYSFEEMNADLSARNAQYEAKIRGYEYLVDYYKNKKRVVIDESAISELRKI